jgi:hypothetical protein
MTLRFRKSIRIAPGIRINFSKKGVSASIGGAPLTLNISRGGVRGTVSAPGTGLSASKFVEFADEKSDVTAQPPAPQADDDAELRGALWRAFWTTAALIAIFYAMSLFVVRPSLEPDGPSPSEKSAPAAPPNLHQDHKKAHK